MNIGTLQPTILFIELFIEFYFVFSCYSSSWARGPLRFPSPKLGLGFYHLRHVWGSAGVSAIRKAICNICIFLKIFFMCKASAPKFPLKFFPVFLLSKVFSLVKAQCLVFSPNTFRFGLKRGGMLGTHVWSILPSPISSTFTNVHFYPHLTLCILFLLFLLSISTFNERLSDSCK